MICGAGGGGTCYATGGKQGAGAGGKHTAVRAGAAHSRAACHLFGVPCCQMEDAPSFSLPPTAPHPSFRGTLIYKHLLKTHNGCNELWH